MIIHRHPYFYALRNHIVDCLVTAARRLPPTRRIMIGAQVPVVRIGNPTG